MESLLNLYKSFTAFSFGTRPTESQPFKLLKQSFPSKQKPLMIDIKACMHNLSKANYHFPRCDNFAQFIPPFKGILASFARGIRNIGFCNPENSSRNPESHKRLESGIQVPPSKSGVESRIQHSLGHP